MKTNNISLPYPVLSVDDDFKTPLKPDSTEMTFEEGIKELLFHVKLSMDNEIIKQLIKENKAVYSCEYFCSTTNLRMCKTYREPEFSLTIPYSEVSGNIDFNFSIILSQNINGYKNDFNEDYEDYDFNLEKGDWLAIFPSAFYNVDINLDKIKCIGQIMQIRSTKDQEFVQYDISGNTIYIMLPENLYDMYKKNIKGHKEIVHSSFTLNALTYALMHIDKPEYQTKKWATALRLRIDNEPELSKYNLRDSADIVTLAQEIFANPYKRLFYKINKEAKQ